MDWLKAISVEMHGDWIVAVATLLAAFIGACGAHWLAHGQAKRDRRVRANSAWVAIQAEVESCASIADGYIKDRVASPQSRLSDDVFRASLPVLIADSGPTRNEIDNLLRFYREVDSLNRGLDWRQELGRGASEERRRERDEVNETKANRIMHGGSYYGPLRALLDARIRGKQTS